MICKCCGAEIVAGKRFCQKCGMPAVDYTIRPKEEEFEERGAVSKRIRELKPIVEAIKEKERKEKEEAERKRLEELEEARKKREAELMAMYGEEEEELLEEEEEEEILEEEETLDYDLENLDSNPEETNTSELKSEPAHKVWKHIPGTLTVTQLVEESGAFSGTKISLCGNVCYLETEIDGMIFNLEDEDESVECFVQYPGTDIEYEGLLYTRDDVEGIVSGLKRGDFLSVEGLVTLKENGDPLVTILSIEGPDFYIRCAN